MNKWGVKNLVREHNHPLLSHSPITQACEGPGPPTSKSMYSIDLRTSQPMDLMVESYEIVRFTKRGLYHCISMEHKKSTKDFDIKGAIVYLTTKTASDPLIYYK